MSKTFADRLNRLFETVYPPGRGPHTSAEVIAALKAEGITMSAPYLSQLRSGNRTTPSAATMAALANFFRIKPDYFTDDEYFEKLDRELTWLAQMRARRPGKLVMYGDDTWLKLFPGVFDRADGTSSFFVSVGCLYEGVRG